MEEIVLKKDHVKIQMVSHLVLFGIIALTLFSYHFVLHKPVEGKVLMYYPLALLLPFTYWWCYRTETKNGEDQLCISDEHIAFGFEKRRKVVPWNTITRAVYSVKLCRITFYVNNKFLGVDPRRYTSDKQGLVDLVAARLQKQGLELEKQ